ncbi:MAG: HupE/UreJ family protein [Pseudomonadota bacterium]
MQDFRVWIAALLLCVLCGGDAYGHTRSQSFSTWTLDGATAQFTFQVDRYRITQLSPAYPDERELTSLLKRHLRDTIIAQQDRAPCTVTIQTVRDVSSSNVSAYGDIQCPVLFKQSAATVSVGAFHDVSPTHMHIASIRNGAASGEAILRSGQTRIRLSENPSPVAIPEFIAIGFWHVLSGPDHLFFLAALMLAAQSRRALILCVTAFTLGHTLTLGLAYAGVLHPNTQLIEAMIGFTILAAALDAGAKHGLPKQIAYPLTAAATTLIALSTGNMQIIVCVLFLALFLVAWSKSGPSLFNTLTPIIALAFGLAHGAGFAGGLMELELTGGGILAPLFGFNLGVELGQFAFASTLAIVNIGLIKHLPNSAWKIHASLGACLFAAGFYWFTERLIS